MKIFVVLSVAIPVQKLNCLATKIVAVCDNKEKAEQLRKINEIAQKPVVYGLECKMYSSVLPFDIDEPQDECYIIVCSAIPVEKYQHPVQTNVHSVHTIKRLAEKTAVEIMDKKEIVVKGIKCTIQCSIVPSAIIRG